MQPVFIHQRFDLRQLDHLMPNGIWVGACQGHPASATLSRKVIIHTAALVGRVEFALMSLVTGLSATLLTTPLVWLPGRLTRRVTRERLRYSARKSPRLFPEPLILGTQAADFFFQRGQSLQLMQNHPLNTGRCELPLFRSNLKIGRSQPFRFHGSETTKSGVAFHEVFYPVNEYNDLKVH